MTKINLTYMFGILALAVLLWLVIQRILARVRSARLRAQKLDLKVRNTESQENADRARDPDRETRIAANSMDYEGGGSRPQLPRKST